MKTYRYINVESLATVAQSEAPSGLKVVSQAEEIEELFTEPGRGWAEMKPQVAPGGYDPITHKVSKQADLVESQGGGLFHVLTSRYQVVPLTAEDKAALCPDAVLKNQIYKALFLKHRVTVAALKAFVAAMPEDKPEEQDAKYLAETDLDSASSIRRNHPLVGDLMSHLGLDKEAGDDLFLFASTL